MTPNQHARQLRNYRIVNMYARNISSKAIADKFSLTDSHVMRIVRQYKDEAGIVTRPGPRSETAPHRKLDTIQALAALHQRGVRPAKEVAQHFGVTAPTIYRLWNRQSWPGAWAIYQRKNGHVNN